MAQYDPNKKYGWEKDTKFEMNGNEFGLILNTFRSFLQRPESRQVLLINDANKAIEAALARTVEAGIVTEMVEEAGPQPVEEKVTKPSRKMAKVPK